MMVTMILMIIIIVKLLWWPYEYEDDHDNTGDCYDTEDDRDYNCGSVLDEDCDNEDIEDSCHDDEDDYDVKVDGKYDDGNIDEDDNTNSSYGCDIDVMWCQRWRWS